MTSASNLSVLEPQINTIRWDGYSLVFELGFCGIGPGEGSLQERLTVSKISDQKFPFQRYGLMIFSKLS